MKQNFNSLLISGFFIIGASTLSCTSDTATKDDYLVEANQSENSNEFTYVRQVGNEDLTLIVTNLAPDSKYQTRLRLINTFYEVYPLLKSDFEIPASNTVTLIIDPNNETISTVNGTTITISNTYLKENEFNTDIFTKSLMASLQNASPATPQWLTDGFGEYIRYKYGLNNQNAGWSLPEYTDNQVYTDGGVITGRFLVWFELNWGFSNIKTLNDHIANGNYTDEFWINATANSEVTNDALTLNELWDLYRDKHSIVVPIGEQIDWTSEASITVSQDNDSGADAAEGSSKLIDNDINTKFLTYNYVSGLWIQQEFQEAKEINKYSFTSANDAPSRDPKDWVLSGSNDGITWTELDVRTNETFADRYLTQTYSFDTNEVSYKYYRCTVNANSGDWIFQLAEWRLIYEE